VTGFHPDADITIRSLSNVFAANPEPHTGSRASTAGQPLVTMLLRSSSVVFALALLLISRVAVGCMVPVFRYALENWPAAPYRMVILHQSNLLPEQLRWLESLGPRHAPGIEWEIHNIENGLPEHARELMSKAEWNAKMDPYGFLFLPIEQQSRNPLIWQGTLGQKGAADLKHLVHSPLTLQILRALSSGDSAVWILLKGTDPKANQRAKDLLSDTLTAIQDKLKLPHQLDPADTVYARPPAPGVLFQFRFGIVEADIDAPENELLRQILSTKVPGRLQASLPMVVPVYGRNRALALLYGEDISESVFWDISSFLVGPCSCRIKEMNPGFDFPALFPWDDIVFAGADVEDVIRKLIGP